MSNPIYGGYPYKHQPITIQIDIERYYPNCPPQVVDYLIKAIQQQIPHMIEMFTMGIKANYGASDVFQGKYNDALDRIDELESLLEENEIKAG